MEAKALVAFCKEASIREKVIVTLLVVAAVSLSVAMISKNPVVSTNSLLIGVFSVLAVYVELTVN